MMGEFFPLITTTRREKRLDVLQAERFQCLYGGVLVERKEQSLEELFQEPHTHGVVVMEEGNPTLYHPDGVETPLRFHLNIGALRLQKVEKGENDRFLQITGIEKGMNVLDGTLGLGTDALLAAWGVGKTGKVIALEGSKAIFSIVDFSLGKLAQEDEGLVGDLARRIELNQISFTNYCETQESNCFDIVYLDPMFDKPRGKSIGIQPIRFWAQEEQLTEDMIRAACRLCRERVVIKEAKASRWWQEMHAGIPSELTGQRYQSVRYRVLNKELL